MTKKTKTSQTTQIAQMNQATETKKKESKPLNKTLHQWLALNKVLKTSKIIGLTQSLAMILLTLLCLGMYFSSPIVVAIKDEHKLFLKGERKATQPSKEDIKRFIEEYIRHRYHWEQFNQKTILNRISPFVTMEFHKRLSAQLKKEDNRSIKGKKVKQVTADVQVQVGEKSIVASFYKLLIIENIPLPIFAQVSFKLKRGARTKANRQGMYVHGIIKHERKSS